VLLHGNLWICCMSVFVFDMYMYMCIYIHTYTHTRARTHKGRDSVVGIATRYRLGGPVMESWWGARFSAPLQTGPRAHPATYTMGTVSFLGVKWLGRGVDHPHNLAPKLTLILLTRKIW
jgi:hypothetical protein